MIAKITFFLKPLLYFVKKQARSIILFCTFVRILESKNF